MRCLWWYTRSPELRSGRHAEERASNVYYSNAEFLGSLPPPTPSALSSATAEPGRIQPASGTNITRTVCGKIVSRKPPTPSAEKDFSDERQKAGRTGGGSPPSSHQAVRLPAAVSGVNAPVLSLRSVLSAVPEAHAQRDGVGDGGAVDTRRRKFHRDGNVGHGLSTRGGFLLARAGGRRQ